MQFGISFPFDIGGGGGKETHRFANYCKIVGIRGGERGVDPPYAECVADESQSPPRLSLRSAPFCISPGL